MIPGLIIFGQEALALKLNGMKILLIPMPILILLTAILIVTPLTVIPIPILLTVTPIPMLPTAILILMLLIVILPTAIAIARPPMMTLIVMSRGSILIATLTPMQVTSTGPILRSTVIGGNSNFILHI